jgi:hypothetical protein
VARDPADAEPRYDARRLGPAVRRALVAAVASFAAIAAIGALRHG